MNADGKDFKARVLRAYQLVKVKCDCTPDEVVCKPQLRREFLVTVYTDYGQISLEMEYNALKTLLGLRKSGKLAPEGKVKAPAYTREEGDEVE